MYALAPKRCQHCVGVLAAVALDQAQEFAARGPVLVCERCDSVPGTEETFHVPDDWD
jgi:hypothetical protein